MTPLHRRGIGQLTRKHFEVLAMSRQSLGPPRGPFCWPLESRAQMFLMLL